MSTIDIPGFEVLEKLGQGGMATVWKARQVTLDRIVAVKVMHPGLGTDESDIERFRTEAQSAAKLKHPGIVQMYDANTMDDTYYFVMEFVAGYSVGDWIRRKTALTEEDALSIGVCIADALAYAWETQRIVHCDIKPDNVVIDADGTVKVVDLGLARSIRELGAQQTDEIMGTPAYIAPEQALGARRLDFHADMYSVGAMMYHMVTGRTMFDGGTDTEVLNSQVGQQVSDIFDLNQDVSEGFCWVLEKLLMKEQDNRYSTWEDLLADLDRVKEGLPPLAEPLPEGMSSMSRSEERTVETYRDLLDDVDADLFESEPDEDDVLEEQGAQRNMMMIVGAAAVGVVALIIVITLIVGGPDDPEKGQTTVTTTTVGSRSGSDSNKSASTSSNKSR